MERVLTLRIPKPKDEFSMYHVVFGPFGGTDINVRMHDSRTSIPALFQSYGHTGYPSTVSTKYETVLSQIGGDFSETKDLLSKLDLDPFKSDVFFEGPVIVVLDDINAVNWKLVCSKMELWIVALFGKRLFWIETPDETGRSMEFFLVPSGSTVCASTDRSETPPGDVKEIDAQAVEDVDLFTIGTLDDGVIDLMDDTLTEVQIEDQGESGSEKMSLSPSPSPSPSLTRGKKKSQKVEKEEGALVLKFDRCVQKGCRKTGTCKVDGCSRPGKYNVKDGEFEPGQFFCPHHKKSGMCNRSEVVCEHEDCLRTASFGPPGMLYGAMDGQTRRFRPIRFCGTHADRNTMVKYYTEVCIHEGCNQQARFNIDGHPKRWCTEHKKEGMVLIQYQCRQKGCKMQARWGFENEGVTSCSNHKKDGMVEGLERPTTLQQKKRTMNGTVKVNEAALKIAIEKRDDTKAVAKLYEEAAADQDADNHVRNKSAHLHAEQIRRMRVLTGVIDVIRRMIVENRAKMESIVYPGWKDSMVPSGKFTAKDLVVKGEKLVLALQDEISAALTMAASEPSKRRTGKKVKGKRRRTSKMKKKGDSKRVKNLDGKSTSSSQPSSASDDDEEYVPEATNSSSYSAEETFVF